MARNIDIPSLSSKVDLEVRRAFAAIKARVESIGAVISDSELTGTGAFFRRSNGQLVANIQSLDYTTPPQISGLTATASLNSILLSWTPPTFRSLARVEIWRSLTDDLDTAGMIGTTGSTGFLDIPEGVTVSSIYYYWVRIVSAAGVVGPFNDTAGTPGSISDDPSYLLDLLADQIGLDQLDSALGAKVDDYDAHLADLANPHGTDLDQVTGQGADSSRLFSCGGKVAFTPEGGLAIKLTNKTGAASVKGSVLTMSDSYDDAFELQTAEFDGVAVCYESGVADGSEAWCVVSGIAEVLLKDGTAATHGSWAKCADTDGRAEVTTPPTGIGALATSEHFKEIGHCIESKASGTDVLAKIVLHWN